MAKIHKLTKGGQTIYPATTTDAVVHPTTRKNLTEELTELNKRILDETKRAKTAEEANATAIEALANELEALGACGFARVNGSADPDAQVTFGNTSKLRSLASHLHLGVFKNGKLLKQCAPGRLTQSVDGRNIAIDGTDGDVMNFTDCDLYYLRTTMQYTPQGGTEGEYNIVALSLLPFGIGGKQAKRIRPFAIVPGECVTAKLEGDARNCAHYVYNKNAIGTYSAPLNIFKKSYKTSGGGYPTQNVSAVQSIKNAQAKNADEATNRPYMGMYYEFYEIIICLMSFEIGTWAHTRLNLFGAGCTILDSVNATTFADSALTANSGWKVIIGDTVKYSTLRGVNMVIPPSSANKTNLIGGISGNTWCGFLEIMEAQRLLDGISKAGLVPKIGNIGNVFTFDAAGNVSCTTDGSVNLSTGAGMEACKHYYVVRNVPGCEGMADGVMTAVVNSYTKMEFIDGVKWSDNTVLDGGIGILKRSVPIYRGWNLPIVGLSRQMDGAYYIVRKDSEGNNLPVQFRCASDVSRVPARTTYSYRVHDNEESDMEKGLDLKKEYPGVNFPVASESWVKKSDYDFSLFCAETTGGGSRNYENAYLWLYINNDVNANERCLHGSVVGCLESFIYASVRTSFCNYNAANKFVHYAGAFSIPFIEL